MRANLCKLRLMAPSWKNGVLLPDGNHGKTASGVAQGVEYYQEGITAQKELL